MTHGLARALLGTLSLAALAGCGGSTEFEITRTFQLRGAGAVSAVEEVSLRDAAGDAWDHRDQIDDLTIRSAVATVTAVGAANTAPSATIRGEVSRGDGAALERAEVVDAEAAIAVGAAVEGQDLEAASALVERALERDGRLSVRVEATLPPATAADFTVEVVLRVEADWSLF